MTADEYINRVFYRVSRGNPQRESSIYRAAIQATKDDARHKYALMSIGKGYHNQLEFDFPLSLTNNHATFGTYTDIIPESIPICDGVRHGSVSYKLKPVDRLSDLEAEAAIPNSPFGFYYPSLVGVDVAYGTAVLTGTLTVRAVRVPSFGTAIPVNTEHHLIDIGSVLAIARLLDEGNMTQEESQKASSSESSAS